MSLVAISIRTPLPAHPPFPAMPEKLLKRLDEYSLIGSYLNLEENQAMFPIRVKY